MKIKSPYDKEIDRYLILLAMFWIARRIRKVVSDALASIIYCKTKKLVTELLVICLPASRMFGRVSVNVISSKVLQIYRILVDVVIKWKTGSWLRP
ncbi:MAG: hypothetical protein SVY53_06030 [Chloroflexota bacterium]|nr:hypothetical protein [Chloroflexota bacterium]